MGGVRFCERLHFSKIPLSFYADGRCNCLCFFGAAPSASNNCYNWCFVTGVKCRTHASSIVTNQCMKYSAEYFFKTPHIFLKVSILVCFRSAFGKCETDLPQSLLRHNSPWQINRTLPSGMPAAWAFSHIFRRRLITIIFSTLLMFSSAVDFSGGTSPVWSSWAMTTNRLGAISLTFQTEGSDSFTIIYQLFKSLLVITPPQQRIL